MRSLQESYEFFTSLGLVLSQIEKECHELYISSSDENFRAMVIFIKHFNSSLREMMRSSAFSCFIKEPSRYASMVFDKITLVDLSQRKFLKLNTSSTLGPVLASSDEHVKAKVALLRSQAVMLAAFFAEYIPFETALKLNMLHYFQLFLSDEASRTEIDALRADNMQRYKSFCYDSLALFIDSVLHRVSSRFEIIKDILADTKARPHFFSFYVCQTILVQFIKSGGFTENYFKMALADLRIRHYYGFFPTRLDSLPALERERTASDESTVSAASSESMDSVKSIVIAPGPRKKPGSAFFIVNASDSQQKGWDPLLSPPAFPSLILSRR